MNTLRGRDIATRKVGCCTRSAILRTLPQEKRINDGHSRPKSYPRPLRADDQRRNHATKHGHQTPYDARRRATNREIHKQEAHARVNNTLSLSEKIMTTDNDNSIHSRISTRTHTTVTGSHKMNVHKRTQQHPTNTRIPRPADTQKLYGKIQPAHPHHGSQMSALAARRATWFPFRCSAIHKEQKGWPQLEQISYRSPRAPQQVQVSSEPHATASCNRPLISSKSYKAPSCSMNTGSRIARVDSDTLPGIWSGASTSRPAAATHWRARMFRAWARTGWPTCATG